MGKLDKVWLSYAVTEHLGALPGLLNSQIVTD